MVEGKGKLCTRCNKFKLLNEENWYKARPTATHKAGGWQSYCKECWRSVNRENKERRKSDTVTESVQVSEDSRTIQSSS